MRNKHLKMDSVDCRDLIYVMGEYRCLRYRARVNDSEACYQCKFADLRVREAAIKKEKEHAKKAKIYR